MPSFPITAHAPALDPQAPFDVAVAIPTLLRATLDQAVRSIYAQDIDGTVQILIGVDRAQGDRAMLDRLQADLPERMALTLLDPGYSTGVRWGGQARALDGGALRTVLSFLANSRRVAYLDDDNWMAPDHLSALVAALGDRAWAYSLRWFVPPPEEDDLDPAIDVWESIGPRRGLFAKTLGGWIDPNCLMIDRVAAESALPCWSQPIEALGGWTADRHVFRHLLAHFPEPGATGRATVHYRLNPKDDMHRLRLALMRGEEPSAVTGGRK